jgi:endonuclease YncB( thermonuclease family)
MRCYYASFVALILLVFSVQSTSLALGQDPDYVVTRVLDAYTFEIGGVGRVRLLGVARPLNQPSADQAWREARKYCQANLVGKKVKLETDLQKSNDDGQALVYLYLEDGTLFNVELVRAGLATVATNALLHLQELRAAEEEARQNHRGVWSDNEVSESKPSVESPSARAGESTTPQSESTAAVEVPANPPSTGPTPAQVKTVDDPGATSGSTAPDPTSAPGEKSVDSAPASRGLFPGARLFIENMDYDLDGFIRAEIVKQEVPLVVVLDIEQADLVMTGSASAAEKGSWLGGLLTPIERDKNTGNVMVFNKAEKVMLWASEAGDRSVFWGALKRGGPRKVAERLVGNLKKEIQKQE